MAGRGQTAYINLNDGGEPGPRAAHHADGDDGRGEEGCQAVLGTVINSLYARLFVVGLIALDVVLLVVEFIAGFESTVLQIIILALLCVELFLRIAAMGLSFFTSAWNVFDFAITLGACVAILVLELVEHVRFLVALRVLRLLRICFLAVREQRHLPKATQTHVSQRFRRFQQDGFNLDISYISDRLLGMSTPAAGRVTLYRNPIDEVSAFFDFYHGGRYRVFSLCTTQLYDVEDLDFNVVHMPLPPGFPPGLEDAWKWCSEVDEFLSVRNDRVVALHCDDGTGRTGSMACAYLLHSKECQSAEEALARFARKRCVIGGISKDVGGVSMEGWRDTFPGVDFPSQRKFVEYFARSLHLGGMPKAHVLPLRSIRINCADRALQAFGDLWYTISEGTTAYDSRDPADGGWTSVAHLDCNAMEFVRLRDGFVEPVRVRGDVHITFMCGQQTVAFRVYFHTAFIPWKAVVLDSGEGDDEDAGPSEGFALKPAQRVMTFDRVEVDHAHEPKYFERLSKDFGVELRFDDE